VSGRILIAGSFGMANIGDEAILQAMIEGFRSRDPDIYMQVVAGSVDRIRNRFGVEALPWDNWAEIFAAAERSDVLIQGGGGLFFDYGNFHPEWLLQNGAADLNHYGSIPLVAALTGKRYMIFGCGVGPIESSQGAEMVRLAFHLARRATVRDGESKALLDRIGVDTRRVRVTADPAFMLPTSQALHSEGILGRLGIVPNRPIICVVLRRWDEFGPELDWVTDLAKMIGDFAASKNAQVVLFPFQHVYDSSVQAAVMAEMAGSAPKLIDEYLSPDEAIGVIAASDLVVGMRLHSIAFSIMTGTAVIALGYAPKVCDLMREVGYEDYCFELHNLTQLSEAIESGWAQREKIGEDFKRAHMRLKESAQTNLDVAMELMDKPDEETPLDASSRTILTKAILGRLKEIRAYESTLQTLIDELP
jgi:polysaccharide pyruvyl transferase CsaB